MEEAQAVGNASPSDRSNAENHHSPPPASCGVGTCYVFKSRLQEYAQKVGITTPVYHTLKEGPSHEPVFKSTVIVNDVKYESLPGFFNRKAAEQSAAEVALMEIHKSGVTTESIPTVHETGLCKNMLQEYAQKMNYAIPSYKCSKQEDAAHPFICTVEIGSIQYIGAAARTKKEAEIKAARTALLAIKDGSEMNANGYTVLPSKKKGREQQSGLKASEQLKPKKAKMKKKWPKRKFPRKEDKAINSENSESLNPNDKGEDALMLTDRGENEQGSIGTMDEPQSQINEPTTLAVKMNGTEMHEKQVLPITLKVERFEEPREAEIMDAALAVDRNGTEMVEKYSVRTTVKVERYDEP